MAMTEMPPIASIAFTAASSIRLVQSHTTFPTGVWTSRARCPMASRLNAKAVSPGSSVRTAVWWPRCSSSRVIHACPFQLTYWRSSSQTAQRSGGRFVSACWTPQVAQM